MLSAPGRLIDPNVLFSFKEGGRQKLVCASAGDRVVKRCFVALVDTDNCAWATFVSTVGLSLNRPRGAASLLFFGDAKEYLDRF